MINEPSILVVDDQPENFDTIEALLHDQDYQLYYASSGQEAIDSLDIFQPDLILLDVMMPGLNGIEVCRKIKALPQWQTVPIVMVTALTSKEDLDQCIQAGADDFISKPVNRIELRARVHSMLRIKQQYDNIKMLSKLQENTIDLLQTNLTELRGNLASSLPHELNTPLNGLFGVIGLLLEDYEEMSLEEVHEMLILAKKSALRLDRLTHRFLNYVQLEFIPETHQIELERQRKNKISTLFILENTAKKCAEAAERITDLIFDIEDLEITMLTKDFQSILEELLENAFKFSQPGTPVEVKSYERDDRLHLLISDRGKGMTAEQMDKIGAFMQFDRKYYEQQGLGLGLAIVKKIVETYTGKLLVSSVWRQGTTVEIQLPLTRE